MIHFSCPVPSISHLTHGFAKLLSLLHFEVVLLFYRCPPSQNSVAKKNPVVPFRIDISTPLEGGTARKSGPIRASEADGRGSRPDFFLRLNDEVSDGQLRKRVNRSNRPGTDQRSCSFLARKMLAGNLGLIRVAAYLKDLHVEKCETSSTISS